MRGKPNKKARESTPRHASSSPLEVLQAFTKLGLTSFGGPVAHLGYFHEEFVSRRKWLAERDHADLVALCQFLPGPASSQAGIGIGISRAGLAGGLAAFLAFTAPSAPLLVERHGGEVSLGRGPESGTRARVELPADSHS